MTILTLNSSEFPINGYNRYTSIDNAGVHSNANVNFVDNSQYNALTHIGAIHSLSISIDGSLVYSLSNIDARITNINEYLSDAGVSLNATISFDIVDAE